MPQINRSALMPFTQKDIFNLVNDVEAYPDFLPWCSSAKVLEKTCDQVLAKLTLKKVGVSYELVTRNRLSPFNLIDIEFVEGPLQSLKGVWLFTELGDLGCKVEMSLSFELKKRFIDKAMGTLLENAAEDMVSLFSARAASVLTEL